MTTIMSTIMGVGLGVAAVLGLSCTALAQDATPYPSRAVRLVAAAAPGGNPDVLARLLSQKLTDALGRPFVVENVPGAGGVVAAKSVATAPPDGHVLMLGDSGALAINIAINPDIGYDPLRDFAPITALATVPTALVINPSVPARTLQDFIGLVRSKPGQMSYGSAGAGSIHHLTMAIFAERAGIDLLHVPYRGGSALVNGLLTGEIQAGWSGLPNVISLIDGGKLRALCLSVLRRSSSVPSMPTCDEVGLKGFDIATMIGLQAPAGTPAPIIARLQATVAQALRGPDMAERMATLGIDLQENGTAHYAQFMKDDLERYRAEVKKLNLQIKPQ
jgi:tripartite-type tricarboxylate transporter receptor subunit TctC